MPSGEFAAFFPLHLFYSFPHLRCMFQFAVILHILSSSCKILDVSFFVIVTD